MRINVLKVAVVDAAGRADLLPPGPYGEPRSLARVLAAGRVDADVVLLLADGEPVRSLRALVALAPHVPPIVVVARSVAPGDVVPILRAGALCLLVHGQYDRADLVDALRAAAGGQSRLSPDALTAVVRYVKRPATDPPALSRRERQIMDLVAAGESNRHIAARLGLAEKTVRNQVSRIYRKLRVRNRTEAIVSWLDG